MNVINDNIFNLHNDFLNNDKLVNESYSKV